MNKKWKRNDVRSIYIKNNRKCFLEINDVIKLIKSCQYELMKNVKRKSAST